MSSTAILTEDTATIVAEEGNRFSWGIAIAGAIAATATIFFLLTLGSGVGLALVHPEGKSVTAFVTLGAIYFLASQAFGFAVGGYLVGRLIGPEVETNAEEEFRAAAHGLVMWALVVVASILLVAASSAATSSALSGAVLSRQDNSDRNVRYWVDGMFRPAFNTPQVAADKAEASRIFVMDGMGQLNDSDTDRLARMIATDAGISMSAAMGQIADAEGRIRQSADDARKAGAIIALWTAFALLFGAIVAVAAAVSARWMDDRITFSMTSRRP